MDNQVVADQSPQTATIKTQICILDEAMWQRCGMSRRVLFLI